MKKLGMLILGEIVAFLLIIITSKIFIGQIFPVNIEGTIIICTVAISGIMIYCTNIISEKLEEINTK